jgi:hypothetical protein
MVLKAVDMNKEPVFWGVSLWRPLTTTRFSEELVTSLFREEEAAKQGPRKQNTELFLFIVLGSNVLAAGILGPGAVESCKNSPLSGYSALSLCTKLMSKPLAAGYFHTLLLAHEDGGTKFLRNIGELPDCTVAEPSRLYCVSTLPNGITSVGTSGLVSQLHVPTTFTPTYPGTCLR